MDNVILKCVIESILHRNYRKMTFWSFSFNSFVKFHGKKIWAPQYDCYIQRGSCMVWEISMGVCPRLDFKNIMLFNCLGYNFNIYGAF